MQEILQRGEVKSKRFFQYQESICRWKIESLLQLKTKTCFNEGSRKLVKSQKNQIRFSFFLLILLGHTHSYLLVVLFLVGFVLFCLFFNSSVNGQTLRITIRISLIMDLCALLDQIWYTINRK